MTDYEQATLTGDSFTVDSDDDGGDRYARRTWHHESSELTLGSLWRYIDRMNSTNSRNKTQNVIASIIRHESYEDAYRALRGFMGDPFPEPDRELGFQNALVRDAVVDHYPFSRSEFSDMESDAGSITAALAEYHDATPTLTDDEDDITIGTAFDVLDDLADHSTEAVIVDGIKRTFERTAYPWVVTFLILDDLSFGAGNIIIRNAVIDACDILESDGENAFDLLNRDPALVFKYHERGELPHETTPGVRPNPMKAKTDMPDEYDESEWLAQYKYDGARAFIHRADNGEMGIRTGGGLDWTDACPELDEIAWPDTDFILDAEVVAYEPGAPDDEPKPMQHVMERVTRENDIEAAREKTEVRFKVFDCIHLDGRDLRHHDYERRWEQCRERFPDDVLATTMDDVDECFAAALEDNHEGIIAKRRDSKYDHGRSSQWRKVKPEAEPIDVRVTEVEQGTGDLQRRVGDCVGAFRVACLDGMGDPVDLGWVGTGLTDDERRMLWETHEADELEGSVVEVGFEELQQNDDGWGLRFPRFIRVRETGEVERLDRVKRVADFDA